MTTYRAEQVWEAFKGELIVEPTEDMKEALASSIRVISSLIERDGVLENEPWHLHIAKELNEISYDVEAL